MYGSAANKRAYLCSNNTQVEFTMIQSERLHFQKGYLLMVFLKNLIFTLFFVLFNTFLVRKLK